MASQEEGIVTPAEGAAPEGTAPNPAAGAPAASGAPAAGADGPRGWDAAAEWLGKQEVSDDDLKAHLDDLGPSAFESLGERERILLTAMHRRFDADRKAEAEKATKAAEEREAKVKAEADRVAKMERDVKARERAMLAAASGAKDPGEKPDVDPFTNEGADLLAKYHAEKAVFEAQKPLREQGAEEARIERWNATVDRYPDLRKPDVLEAFNAYMVEKNKGVKPGQKPRLNTEDGAEAFFNARELESLRNERAKKQQADDLARAQAARNIGHSAGPAAPNYLDIYRTIKAQRGDEAADEYLDNNPQAMAAYKRHFAPNYAN